MAVAQEKAVKRPGVGVAIGVAGLVGLIGGFLAGAWDGFAVLLWNGAHVLSPSDIFHLSLYSLALYGAVGFVLMAAIGAVGTGLIYAGRYRVQGPRLAGIFVGIFVALVVYVFLPEGDNWVEILEFIVISIFSGMALGILSVYLLRSRIRNSTLAAALIALVVWVCVLLCGALWINSSILTEERFWKLASLFSTLGLLLAVSLFAIGLYRLLRYAFQKYDRRRTRQAGWTLLAVVAAAAIAISSVGPFNSDTTSASKAAAASPISGNITEKPNILLIVMDTVRPDHLSCYGYERNTTPNIDRIASEGILFENAFATAPWTLPSHASMFTSTYPTDHNTTAEHRWLGDDFETIAELLSSLGYQTYGYSNNPFVSQETNLNQGFDTFITKPFGQQQLLAETDTELPDLLRLREYIDRLFNGDDEATQDEGEVEDNGAQETNEVVKGWIADAQQEEKPFFIFINYMEAHAPYYAPPQFSLPYLPADVSLTRAKGVNQDSATYIAEAVYMSEKDFEILTALYDAAIAYLDYMIGQLVDYLEESGILDNTVLIICSDHGENIGDHNLLGHQLCVYDSLLHVFLIIRYPELFDAGMRVDEQVQLTDLFPTMTDAVRYYRNGEQPIRGYSLRRLLKNPESRPAVAEYEIFATVLENLRNVAKSVNNPSFDTSKYAHRLKSVRYGDYKYIWTSDGRDELYNIRLDPGELNNIIESRPEKAKEMRALLSEELGGFEP